MAHMNPSAILQQQFTQFPTLKNDALSPSINTFSPLEQPNKEATKKMEENKGFFLLF